METLEHDLAALVGRELLKQAPPPLGKRWGVATGRLLEWIKDRMIADAQQVLANRERFLGLGHIWMAVHGREATPGAASDALKAMDWPALETDCLMLGTTAE